MMRNWLKNGVCFLLFLYTGITNAQTNTPQYVAPGFGVVGTTQKGEIAVFPKDGFAGYTQNGTPVFKLEQLTERQKMSGYLLEQHSKSLDDQIKAHPEQVSLYIQKADKQIQSKAPPQDIINTLAAALKQKNLNGSNDEIALIHTKLAQAYKDLGQARSPNANARNGKVFKGCPNCQMVRIPGKNYEIGKYEVTQGEWRAVMGNNPSQFSNCGDTCPVEQVSWNDVQEFIQKLNAKTGRQYRLPTEAEWEYACYGGSQAEYCGGNNIDSVAWYDGNSGNTTHSAGQKQANGYGLYDMSGNVWEWMSDCYNGNCEERVLRGGSWGNVPGYARAADRSRGSMVYRYDYEGFRLARTLP